jgi:hypothetical protein
MAQLIPDQEGHFSFFIFWLLLRGEVAALTLTLPGNPRQMRNGKWKMENESFL